MYRDMDKQSLMEEIGGESWWEKLVGEVGGKSWWGKLVENNGGEGLRHFPKAVKSKFAFFEVERLPRGLWIDALRRAACPSAS